MSTGPTDSKQWGTVLILLFDGINTLDVNGPLEVLCNYALRKQLPPVTKKPQHATGEQHATTTEDPPPLWWCPYNIVFASKDGCSVQAFEFIRVGAKCETFTTARQMIARGEVDALITPGYAPPTVGSSLIADKTAEIWSVLRDFYVQKSPPRPDGKPRWMISICVGAILMNNIGCFDGRVATTHFGALPDLQKNPGKVKEWVRQRWVDGGVTADNGVRIVSSGGIACGIDCMLWFVRETLGLPEALAVAEMMDYVYDRALTGLSEAATQQP